MVSPLAAINSTHTHTLSSNMRGSCKHRQQCIEIWQILCVIVLAMYYFWWTQEELQYYRIQNHLIRSKIKTIRCASVCVKNVRDDDWAHVR